MKHDLRVMSRLGRWAFWLGIASVAWGMLVPLLAGLLISGRPADESDTNPLPFGLDPVVPSIVLAISALLVGILAERRGERSRLLLAAFIPPAVLAGFGLVYMLVQVLLPH